MNVNVNDVIRITIKYKINHTCAVDWEKYDSPRAHGVTLLYRLSPSLMRDYLGYGDACVRRHVLSMLIFAPIAMREPAEPPTAHIIHLKPCADFGSGRSHHAQKK